MAGKSAYEDLWDRTLGKIEGIWAKLVYVAERRSANGTYQHWGFERAHGTEMAQETFVRVHNSLIETALQTRLQLLREDLEQTCRADGTNPVSYVMKLTAAQGSLLPSNCPKVTKLHLISILKTLSILEARQQPDVRSSSQSLPLGQ